MRIACSDSLAASVGQFSGILLNSKQMTVDWNWFFAAFAQCSAALIGIIGAFIISKLLGESEKEEMQANNANHLIIQHNDLVKRISMRYFNWYDERTIDYSGELGDAIKEGQFDSLSDDEKIKKLHEINPDIFGTIGCLESLNKRIVKLRSRRTQTPGFGIVNEAIFESIVPNSVWDNLSREKEEIDKLRIESETLIEKFHGMSSYVTAAQKNLRPIKITIYILGVALLTTVIYPLHFMPVEMNQEPVLSFSLDIVLYNLFSARGFLLTLLTISIEGIFAYFLILISKTERNYSYTLNRFQESFFDIKTYSEYFK